MGGPMQTEAGKSHIKPVDKTHGHLWRSRLLLSVVLLIAAFFVLRGIHRGEFNLNVDESYHAFTGEYFADLFRSHPIEHPVRYTYEYYAHYPAIALGHWPPLFYFFEGVAFLVFGSSVVVARLTVLAFALFGLIFWFKLVKRLENEFVAVAATLVLAFLPFILLYEKSVMLEIPSLALSITATYYWVRYLQEEIPKDLYWFALLAGLALLTKQNCIYLAPFCLLTIAASRKWRLVIRRRILWALGIVLLVAGPFYIFMEKVYGKAMRIAVEKGSHAIAHPWTYYLKAAPGQLGWPLLILALVGILTWRWWGKRENAILMLMWILSCYLTFNVFAEKAPRYIIYWIPPLVYFAIASLGSVRLPARLRPVGLGILVLIIGTVGWEAWRFQRPYVSGYEAAARGLMSAKDPGVVLYDGSLDANFIFFVRKFDPGMHCFVMRKGLYVTLIDKSYGSMQLAKSKADIETIIGEYGIKYFVVEQNMPINFEIQRKLRQLLKRPQFEVVGVFPVISNMPG
ncbi:MAG: glycosyltransferase family 39 protein, partial [Ktedonobacteraceae bacterium]